MEDFICTDSDLNLNYWIYNCCIPSCTYFALFGHGGGVHRCFPSDTCLVLHLLTSSKSTRRMAKHFKGPFTLAIFTPVATL